MQEQPKWRKTGLYQGIKIEIMTNETEYVSSQTLPHCRAGYSLFTMPGCRVLETWILLVGREIITIEICGSIKWKEQGNLYIPTLLNSSSRDKFRKLEKKRSAHFSSPTKKFCPLKPASPISKTDKKWRCRLVQDLLLDQQGIFFLYTWKLVSSFHVASMVSECLEFHGEDTISLLLTVRAVQQLKQTLSIWKPPHFILQLTSTAVLKCPMVYGVITDKSLLQEAYNIYSARKQA